MKKIAASTLVALALVLPAKGQTMSSLTPSLTFPDTTITPSTKGCAPQTVCTLQE